MRAAGVGGVGASAAGLFTYAAQAYRRGTLSFADLRTLPRVPEHARPTDRAALGREGVLKTCSEPAPAVRLVDLRITPGEGLEHLGVDVCQHAAEFICDPRRPNLLAEGVTRLSYEIIEVAWQPGLGWPIYRHRSPQRDHAVSMRYPGVPRHQVVFLDDRAIYVGNSRPSGILEGIQGPLRVDVNGDKPSEHRGFYKVLITAIA